MDYLYSGIKPTITCFFLVLIKNQLLQCIWEDREAACFFCDIKRIKIRIKDISQTVNCADLNTRVMEILLQLLQIFGSKNNKIKLRGYCATVNIKAATLIRTNSLALKQIEKK